jgi:restriction system protein
VDLVRSGGNSHVLDYPCVHIPLIYSIRKKAIDMNVKFPDSSTLEASLLKALKANGGSARSDEIDKFVIADLKLTAEQLAQIRNGNRTEIQYRLAWVRTKAKSRGLIEKSANRIWKITEKGSNF